jgi:septin family protein
MAYPPQVKNDPINRRIFNKIYRKDKNVLILVCGETGSCKSGSSLTKCLQLDRTKPTAKFEVEYSDKIIKAYKGENGNWEIKIEFKDGKIVTHNFSMKHEAGTCSIIWEIIKKANKNLKPIKNTVGNQCRFYLSADPFDPKNRVVTSAQAFVQLIGSGLPKGSCIIWDEIGVDADNREYFTLKNRLVKKVFQTFFRLS